MGLKPPRYWHCCFLPLCGRFTPSPAGEHSSPRHMQASRCCGADLPSLSQPPVDSFGGETGSRLEILISINATVVSSRLLSRSIFPPTFLCASQTPPAAGSSPCSSTARYSAPYGWSGLIQCLIPVTRKHSHARNFICGHLLCSEWSGGRHLNELISCKRLSQQRSPGGNSQEAIFPAATYTNLKSRLEDKGSTTAAQNLATQCHC